MNEIRRHENMIHKSQKMPYDDENRTVLCFDFSDIIDGTILYRRDDNMRIRHFSDAMRYGNVKYKEISIYWKMLEIYKYL